MPATPWEVFWPAHSLGMWHTVVVTLILLSAGMFLTAPYPAHKNKYYE